MIIFQTKTHYANESSFRTGYGLKIISWELYDTSYFNLKELEYLIQGSFLNYLWWLFEIQCAIYKNFYIG